MALFIVAGVMAVLIVLQLAALSSSKPDEDDARARDDLYARPLPRVASVDPVASTPDSSEGASLPLSSVRPTEPGEAVRLPVVAHAPASVKAAPVAGSHERTCPFCKDSIAEKNVHIECATCSTWHHATCFEENGGCSVFGCREQRGRGVAGVRAS